MFLGGPVLFPDLSMPTSLVTALMAAASFWGLPANPPQCPDGVTAQYAVLPLPDDAAGISVVGGCSMVIAKRIERDRCLLNAVATHEYGHAVLSLGHQKNPRSIMFELVHKPQIKAVRRVFGGCRRGA